VAGDGEAATRFPAWRRWDAGGKREVGGCGRGEQAAAAACIVAAAAGASGLGAEAAAAATKGGLGVSGGEVDRRRR